MIMAAEITNFRTIPAIRPYRTLNTGTIPLRILQHDAG